jgi:hypothetical protein
MELRDRVRELRQHITDEVIKVLGLPPTGLTRAAFSPLMFTAAQRFSEVAAEFDQRVAEQGLADAARWAMGRFRTRLEVSFRGPIPQQGPLLVASNHPGTVDGLAIAASLERPDLKIVASGLPFIRKLPSLSKHLIYTPPLSQTHERMNVVRTVVRHLKDGGAVLIFPSGRVDPDPAYLPGADQALEIWSPSIGLILKAHPSTQVLISIVSGVLSPANLRNPITRLGRELWERQRLAEFIQVIRQMLELSRETLTARLTMGQAVVVEQIAGLKRDARGLTQGVVSIAQSVLADHLASESTPAQPRV